MNWKTIPLTLSLSLALLCGVSPRADGGEVPNAIAAAGIDFDSPGEDAPYRTTGGASRGSGTCLSNSESLMAITPHSQIGLTAQGHPTLLVYVPSSSGNSLELIVAGDDGTEMVRKNLPLPIAPGIVSFSLTDADMPPLTIGKPYQWYVSLICDDLDRSVNPVVEGWVKRIELDANLSQKLAGETPAAYPALYAEAGIWQETIVTLFEQRLAQPNNPELKQTWEQLLRSVGLGSVSEAALSTSN
ncbi:DUF928 domain-containing protein [Oscillatoriales cyanobacterium LEGE 11467]|uniref:DUF928 domain-containing protein n=1 Tax=Zarconia navalis LEGE 11467 TaxID=1828826 RepID=A0A928VWT1_9CYAN|nr:DUF928 domain-containing protein [Zarconia navalis]MBE9041682.1 DUF928 domain-containing protein [Zarconia navalis LEGE 11467]